MVLVRLLAFLFAAGLIVLIGVATFKASNQVPKSNDKLTVDDIDQQIKDLRGAIIDAELDAMNGIKAAELQAAEMKADLERLYAVKKKIVEEPTN